MTKPSQRKKTLPTSYPEPMPRLAPSPIHSSISHRTLPSTSIEEIVKICQFYEAKAGNQKDVSSRVATYLFRMSEEIQSQLHKLLEQQNERNRYLKTLESANSDYFKIFGPYIRDSNYFSQKDGRPETIAESTPQAHSPTKSVGSPTSKAKGRAKSTKKQNDATVSRTVHEDGSLKTHMAPTPRLLREILEQQAAEIHQLKQHSRSQEALYKKHIRQLQDEIQRLIRNKVTVPPSSPPPPSPPPHGHGVDEDVVALLESISRLHDAEDSCQIHTAYAYL